MVFSSYLSGRDWATLFWFRGGGGYGAGTTACNRNFAGLVGLLRLARLTGDREAERLGYGQLALCSALRFALGRYRRYLYRVGRAKVPEEPEWQVKYHTGDWHGHLVSYNCTKPEDDIEQVFLLNESMVVTGTHNPNGWDAPVQPHRFPNRPYQIPYRFMVPELGRFLAEHLKPETTRYEEVVASYQPDWYISWAESTLGTEHNMNQPCDAYQNFLARAWIIGEPPEKLRKYIDVPHLRVGDYFYIHKLAELARAYRGVEWVEVFKK